MGQQRGKAGGERDRGKTEEARMEESAEGRAYGEKGDRGGLRYQVKAQQGYPTTHGAGGHGGTKGGKGKEKEWNAFSKHRQII